ncbi:hypothetical protein Tco_0927362 [Tanacetum coccineum]
MAAKSTVSQPVDKKGGSYSAIAPKPEPRKFNKWKKRMPIITALDLEDIIKDFQENSDDEVDEKTSEEYLKDLELEFHERALLANSKRHFATDCLSKTSEPSYKSSVSGFCSKGFQPKFTPKLIQFSQSSSNQADPKIQKDYKAEYKKMKAKLALLEAKVLDDEEIIEVKVLMALADDALTVERLNPNNKLLNFNTGRILVPESQAVNESLKPTETSTDPESSKDSGAESLTPLPPLNFFRELHQAQRILYCMISKKEDHRASDHEMYIALLKRSENYKAQPYQYASPSKKSLKAKDTSRSPFGTWIVDAQRLFGVKSYLHKYVEQPGPKVKMVDPNITMEQYIRLEEEKACRRAVLYNNALTSEVVLSSEPTVIPLNDNQIDFRISFDKSDDEDYTDLAGKKSKFW